MQKEAKRIFVLTIGVVFIILGLFGLILPLLQGIIFLAIGLILISLCSQKFRLWVNKHTQPYPQLFSVIKKMETWIAKFIGEI